MFGSDYPRAPHAAHRKNALYVDGLVNVLMLPSSVVLIKTLLLCCVVLTAGVLDSLHR